MNGRQLMPQNIFRPTLFKIFLVSFLCFLQNSYGAQCDNLSSVQEVLNCALERHPEIKIADMGAEQAKDGQRAASQRPNPEMNSQSVFGGESNDNVTTELNLAHTFELGGKRDSRIKKSEANIKFGQAMLAQSREQVFLNTLLALYRLRQIQDELNAVDDALQTFARIGKQYRGRPRLTPEQRASLRIFEVAEQDYKMKRVPLETEKDLHLRTLEITLGQTFLPKLAALPKKKKSWPSLPLLVGKGRGNSKLLATEAELQIAQAELEGAKSDAWPDLKIGPTVVMQLQGSQSFQSYGFNLALPLPLYHRNAGKEAYAAIGAERAALSFRAAQKENESQRSHLETKYLTATTALVQAASTEDLLKKHEEVESLFKQGFLNGTVVIEIHRQVSDFIKSQNEQELTAIESLVRYYALDGHLPEVNE